MIWLTPGGIIKGQNLCGAFMIGLLRVIATKNPTGHFLSINMEGEGFEAGNEDLVRGVIGYKFGLQTQQPDEGAIDSDFAWQDSCMWVS